MTLSIIVTSQNRAKELSRFFGSINQQQGINLKEIQIIFVDQGDNKNLFSQLDDRIDKVYLTSQRCSLSKARNIALPFVKADFLAFGDDDCWYTRNTLQQVFNEFSKGYDGVIGHGLDAEGKETNSQGFKKKLISRKDQCGAISYCIFMKYDKDLRFDENIGVGSPYRLSSGEETDYLLSYMEMHPDFKIIYKPNIIIHHPTGKRGNFSDTLHKEYEYARGWGYVLRKHSLPISVKFKSFIRPIIGIITYGISCKLQRCKKSYFLLKGRIEGYRFKIDK